MSSHLQIQALDTLDRTQLKQGGFTFKQFFVGHDKSPMKITTDSVLLGAWAPINPNIRYALDIGSGCGVIALMLAQRLVPFEKARIDAIDIDEKAVKQCQENIVNSPFSTVSVKEQDIRTRLSNKKYNHYYDLIVCNPPYFESSISCRNIERQHARYTEQLSHAELLKCVTLLLTETGQFCLVLPYHLSNTFERLAMQYQLYLSSRLDVRYTQNKPFSLVLFCFSREEGGCIKQNLCMRHQDGSYTEAFRQLLSAFYLRF